MFKKARKLLNKFHAVAASCFRITLFQVVFYVLGRLIFVLLGVLLRHGNVWNDEHLEEGLQVLSDELFVTRKGRALSEVPHDGENESLTLTIGADFVTRDLFPNLLEEYVGVLLEVLSKFELVKLDHTDDLRSRLEQLLKIRGRLQLRVICFKDEDANFSDLVEVVFVEVGQLLLTENGLEDV